MMYDEKLAERIRKIIPGKGFTEKKMFGGLSFLFNGRMCIGIIKKNLVVRVDEDVYSRLIKKPYVKPMDFTGRQMKGFVYVKKSGYKTEKDLRKWISLGSEYVKNKK